jgi:adenylate cyclase
LSEERTLAYLSDGLSEDITTLLARIPGFLVISRGSAFAYKGKHTDTRQVARDLGVRYVVEGSLRPVGTDIRVTAQLIDAGADNHLWAERFNRPAESVLELQDEITQAIVSRIEPALAGAELTRLQRRAPENLDAWELYQRAHGLLVLKGWAPSTFEEAIILLRQAIAVDRDFALAHGYLSLLLALSHMFQFSSPSPPLDEQAIAAADKAVDLDGRNSAVLGYAGCALCDIGQSQRGVDLLERAVEADPSNAQAWAALGVGLIRSRRPREGVKKLRHGILISPVDARLSYWGTILANTLFRLREYEDALKEAQTAGRRNDRFAHPRLVAAMILAHLGRNAEAVRSMNEAKRIFPDLSVNNITGLIGKRGVKILADANLLN